MVDADDGRAELFAELGVINAELARLGVPAKVPVEVAEIYPTSDLVTLVAAARRQHLTVLFQLGGTA
jgi:hypothetical protein